MNILIENITAVTMNECEIIENAFIAIENGKISYIGAQKPLGDFARTINGNGKAAMPGIINTHTHLPMTLLRGFAGDYPLHTWLNDYIFPAEAKMDEKCVSLGATLGIAECLRFGITSVSEMYFKISKIAAEVQTSGIKANICNGALCFDRANYDFNSASETLEMREMLKTLHNADNGRIRLDAGIHAEYTSFPELWRANAEFAAQNGLNVQIHISETRSEHEECIARHGKTPIEAMRDAGVLDCRTIAAHCVYVSDSDMQIMAQKGVSAAHCPISNLKLASGIASTAKMLKAGVNVALATDGVSSNNSHDMFEEIKLCALLQKGAAQDASAMPALKTLQLATKNGALAQGREKECGMLLAGMDADIILVDLCAPQMQPVHDVAAALCYSATGREVCMTMVRGNILYENGVYTTIDIEKTIREINDYAVPRIFRQ